MPHMTKHPDILVVGAGYVGLATAVFLADKGYPTTVVEKNCEIVEALRRKRLHFHEPTLARTLKKVVGNGFLTIIQPEPEPYQKADLIFIAIDSANRRTWQMRLEPFEQMAGWIGGVKRRVPPTVVLKSTNVLGFTQHVRDLLDNTPHGKEAKLLVSPEFLREGLALEDTVHPSRVVIGALEKGDAAPLVKIYRSAYPETVPIVQTDWKSAELIKLAANTYLAYRLAFIHEIAEFARLEGLELAPIRQGIGLDPRIGLGYFTPGLGFGGSCLPKDCMLINSNEFKGSFEFESAHTATAVNNRLLKNLIELLDSKLGGLKGKRVAILGAAFKPDVDDTRDSRAVRLAELLLKEKVQVSVFDPHLHGRDIIPETELPLAPTIETALKGAHAVIIGAAHKKFLSLKPQQIGGLVVHRLVFDYFGLLDPKKWRAAGFEIVR